MRGCRRGGQGQSPAAQKENQRRGKLKMRTMVLACALSFVVTAAVGPSVIHWLRKMKFGQKILEDGPTWHMKKQNIPTMGVFMFIFGIAVSILVAGLLTGVF